MAYFSRRVLGYQNAASLATNFLDAGYELVVVDYVFEHPRHVELFHRHLAVPAAVYLFTLWAPLETVVARERARPNRERLGQRVLDCYRTMEQNLDWLGRIVANLNKTPAHVVAEIVELITQECGRLPAVAK